MRLKEQQYQDIEKYLKLGWSFRQIARQVGCSVYPVHLINRRLKITPDPRINRASVIKLRKSGLTLQMIAAFMDISYTSVNTILNEADEDMSQYTLPSGCFESWKGQFNDNLGRKRRRYDWNQIKGMKDAGLSRDRICSELLCALSTVEYAIKK